MNVIKLLAQTKDTVTIRRTELESLMSAVEDRGDLASVEAHLTHIETVGWDAAKRGYLTGAETRRLLDGVRPVRVWREKRGLSQRALAEKAGVAAGYLNEIETGKKPGSVHALVALAHALETTVDDLLA